MILKLPYGRGHLECQIADHKVKAVVENRIHQLKAAGEPTAIVREALEHPIGSPRLCELARGKQRALIITSDHTRPVPSRITMPLLLEEMRRDNPNLEVIILVATGAHRASTRKELVEKMGREVVDRERILMHDATNSGEMVFKGTLPSGCTLSVNRLVDWADLIVAEGFIEPHFFAGFSGGRKSILPGIASLKTVMSNHCAKLIAHPRSRTGVLDGNPIHEDMVAAARICGLGFILNVVIDAEKKIVRAFAGHPERAHEAGCDFVAEMMRVDPVPADIVMTSNGGYPLDQNLYQAVKGMTGAEAFVRPGGVIIMVSECSDGHGGERFYRWFRDAVDADEVANGIISVPPEDTQPDQWQVQILARVLQKAQVILVTGENCRSIVEDMHMRWAGSLEEAVRLAEEIKPHHDGIVVLPDGVSVIPG